MLKVLHFCILWRSLLIQNWYFCFIAPLFLYFLYVIYTDKKLKYEQICTTY